MFPDYPAIFWVHAVRRVRGNRKSGMRVRVHQEAVGVKIGIFLNEGFTDIWINRIIFTILLVAGVQPILVKSVIIYFFGT